MLDILAHLPLAHRVFLIAVTIIFTGYPLALAAAYVWTSTPDVRPRRR